MRTHPHLLLIFLVALTLLTSQANKSMESNVPEWAKSEELYNKEAEYLHSLSKLYFIAEREERCAKGMEFWLMESAHAGSSFSSLRLNDMGIDDNAVMLICSYLKNCDHITIVELHSNKITSLGAQHISQLLTVNQTIDRLFLNNNEIGNEGSEYIAQSLKNNKRLKYLDIDNNKITDKGAKSFVDALQVNTTLEHICGLDNKKISKKYKKAIEARCPSNF